MSAASLSMNSPVISISFSRMDEVKRKIERAQEAARSEAESLSRAIGSLQVSDGRLRMKAEVLSSLRSRIIKRQSGLQAMGAHIDYAAKRFREVDKLCAKRISSNGCESGKLQGLSTQSGIYGNIVSGVNSVVNQGIAAWDYVKTNGNRILDCIQIGLDVVGLIPGFGEIADGINAGIYLLRGDYGSAALSLAAMIPVLGCAATAGKFINKGVKAYKQSKNIVNAIDTAGDVYGIVKKTGNIGIQKAAGIASDFIEDARRAIGKSPSLTAEGAGTLRGSLSDFGKAGTPKVEETPVQKSFKAASRDSAAGTVKTGAYNPDLSMDIGDGLGKLTGKSINVSEKGLNSVKNHISQFGDIPENTAMINRIETALKNGQPITGADASFYMHEAAEAIMMKNGISYKAAHEAVLQKYNVSPYSVYHPEVIQQFSEWFNQGFKDFWRLK